MKIRNLDNENVVVVGSQWGDEGKGKIVDWLSSEADIVQDRYEDNAGYTLVINGVTYKLRLRLRNSKKIKYQSLEMELL